MRYDSRLEDRDMRMKKARKLLLEGYTLERIMKILRISENTLMDNFRENENYLKGIFFKKTRSISKRMEHLSIKEVQWDLKKKS